MKKKNARKKCLILILGAFAPPFPRLIMEGVRPVFNEISKGYKNIDVMYYYGSYPLSTEYRIEEDIIHVNSPDDIAHSLHKTMLAYQCVLAMYDYDYILRINASSFINLYLLDKMINDIVNPDISYSSMVVIAPWSEFKPYLSGISLLMSKKTIQGILKLYFAKYINTINMPFDDNAIGQIMRDYYAENYDYMQIFGLHQERKKRLQSNIRDKIKTNLCIQIKTERNKDLGFNYWGDYPERFYDISKMKGVCRSYKSMDPNEFSLIYPLDILTIVRRIRWVHISYSYYKDIEKRL